MPQTLPPILFEDNHLLAMVKPAGLPTMGVAAGRTSLVTIAKDYLKRKYGKPGNVYLGVVSRLDSAVSGVIILARTSKAASRLSEQFRCGEVEKIYWALVESRPEAVESVCVDWLRKDEPQRRMVVCGAPQPGAQLARLRYRTLRTMPGNTLLEIHLETGRKHQIRVQLAHRGCPVLGDRKYGATTPFPHGVALHARQLDLQHPVRKVPLRLEAPLPAAWRKFGILG
ncbi:MAG: RNA pseudouridine synthase [Candidatus Anammoximicrobium sp.]|nr:RNA pseudouridine synthase [Candidatus Anammoximicrobium sp.]